jgi:hypothetical protein
MCSHLRSFPPSPETTATTTCKSLMSELPSSPDGVITYMGRSYELKDLSPCLAERETSPTADDRVPPPSNFAAFARPTAGITRAQSAGSDVVAPLRHSAPTRSKLQTSSQTMPPSRMPARRVKSGGGLMQMALAVNNPDADTVQQRRIGGPSRFRSRSWGETVTGILFKNDKNDDDDDDEKDRHAKFGQHSNSVRSLEYSKEDVVGIVDDHEEFVRLKAALKKKGAITNEVLRQRFHFYVAAKKGRDAGLPTEKLIRQRVQRSQSDAGYVARGTKNNLQAHDSQWCTRDPR